MQQNFTILTLLGVAIIVLSLVAMTIIYFRIFRVQRTYLQGKLYADEFVRRVENLRANITIFGAILLVGVVLVVLNSIFG